MYKLDRYLGSRPQKLRRVFTEQQVMPPLSVKIKLTWHCNLACIMCSEWRIQGAPPPRPNYFDSWEKLQSVLDDLIFLKTKKIHFSGGEPLISPFLDQAVAYLTRQGRHVSLVSNGTLWTRSRAQSLIQAGLGHITFSVDSLNPETFIKIRGKDSWQQLLNGIENVRRAIQSSGRPIKLKTNTVLTRENFRDILDYARAAHDLGIDRLRLIPVDDLHTDHRALRLSLAEINEYNQEIAPELVCLAQKYDLLDSPSEAYPFGRSQAEMEASSQGLYARGFYEQHYCFAPWLHSLIGADGRIHACCMLKGEKQFLEYLSPERSFWDVWQGEKYQQFRQEIQKQRPQICRHCDDFLPENQYLNHLLQSYSF